MESFTWIGVENKINAATEIQIPKNPPRKPIIVPSVKTILANFGLLTPREARTPNSEVRSLIVIVNTYKSAVITRTSIKTIKTEL